MVPPAPGRLSMTMPCPRIDVRRCPMRRAITSAGPAGAKPTTILIGRLGNVCADAMPLAAQATATMAQRKVGLASMAVIPDFILSKVHRPRLEGRGQANCVRSEERRVGKEWRGRV